MGRGTGRPAGCPPSARPRAGQTAGSPPRAGQPAAVQVRKGPRARTGRWLAASLVAIVGLLVAGCGSAASPAFRPAGVAAPDRTPAGGRTGTTAGRAHRPAGTLEWPPFGGNVHIVMPGWLPASPGEVPAVIAAKNFLLAFLYAEYRGNQDDRWTAFVSGGVASALKANLSVNSVTTESFTGTIIFSHLRAYPDPTAAGAVDVSECFDNSRSRNTSLASGKILPDTVPASQHHYMNTDVMAKAGGRWTVISVYPVIYYPRAAECKP